MADIRVAATADRRATVARVPLRVTAALVPRATAEAGMRRVVADMLRAAGAVTPAEAVAAGTSVAEAVTPEVEGIARV